MYKEVIVNDSITVEILHHEIIASQSQLLPHCHRHVRTPLSQYSTSHAENLDPAVRHIGYQPFLEIWDTHNYNNLNSGYEWEEAASSYWPQFVRRPTRNHCQSSWRKDEKQWREERIHYSYSWSDRSLYLVSIFNRPGAGPPLSCQSRLCTSLTQWNSKT